MLITELIERLETMKFLHGDVKVGILSESKPLYLPLVKEVFYEKEDKTVVIA